MNRISRREWRWLAATLGFLFILGTVLAPSYGQSWDEFVSYQYAADSLRAYVGTRTFVGPFISGVPIDWLYGPVHFEFAYGFGQLAAWLPMGYTPTDGRHLATFLVFLLGIGGLYVLCRRHAGRWAAGVTSAIFASQPMLWGHAFVNPKDIPFLSFFILSLAIGLTAVDRLARHPEGAHVGEQDPTRGEPSMWPSCIANDVRGLNSPWGSLALVALVFCLGALIATLFGVGALPAAKGVVTQAYRGEAFPLVQAAFNLVATDSYKTPLNLYLQKLDLVYAWAKLPLALLWLVLIAVTVRHSLPKIWSAVRARIPSELAWILAAGVVLGLTNSIRVAAPLAGAMVIIYIGIRLGRRSWLPIATYATAAMATSYLTWPWLWLAPLANYWASIRVMADFPSRNVLFGGVVYSSAEIPWDYVVRLIGIETTEVVVPIFVLGLMLSFRRASRSRVFAIDLGLWGLWFLVPLGLVLLLRSPLYGNLRQVLFILPPLFIVGGTALDWLFQRARKTMIRWALAACLIFPGAAAMVALHPYEESYFNGWVGWTSGAYGQYQVDPWCTAYREVMDHLNAIASPGSIVDVRGPFHPARDFARSDLDLHAGRSAATPDYAVMCTVDMNGARFYDSLPVIFEVRRGDAVLAIARGRP